MLMKKLLIGATLGSLLVTGSAYAMKQPVAHKDANTQAYTTIVEKKVDVTGDGKADIVKLLGHPYSEVYYNRFYLSVEDTEHHKSMKIKVNEDGYEPNLEFADYNRDNVKDIHFSVANGATGHSPIAHHYYTAKNDRLNEIKGKTEAVQSQIKYQLTGEGRLFEGTYYYRVKNLNETIVQGYGTASIGGPAWGRISQTIKVPKNKLGDNTDLELYVVDEESGKETDKLTISLTMGEDGQTFKNKLFRNIKVTQVK